MELHMLSKQEGIQAIIDLQGYIDIKESEEKALAGWESMSDRQKEITEQAHRVCFPDKYKDQ